MNEELLFAGDLKFSIGQIFQFCVTRTSSSTKSIKAGYWLLRFSNSYAVGLPVIDSAVISHQNKR